MALFSSTGDIFLYSRNSMENEPVPEEIVLNEVEYPNNSAKGASPVIT